MAASTGSQEEGGMIADINVTPLVDVTLVLLIIMMVAAPILVQNAIFGLKLPEAQKGDKQPDKKTLRISLALRKDKQPGLDIYVDGQLVNEPTARKLIREGISKNKDMPAIVQPDARVVYEDIAHWLDIVRVEGIRDVGLEVKQASSPE